MVSNVSILNVIYVLADRLEVVHFTVPLAVVGRGTERGIDSPPHRVGSALNLRFGGWRTRGDGAFSGC